MWGYSRFLPPTLIGPFSPLHISPVSYSLHIPHIFYSQEALPHSISKWASLSFHHENISFFRHWNEVYHNELLKPPVSSPLPTTCSSLRNFISFYPILCLKSQMIGPNTTNQISKAGLFVIILDLRGISPIPIYDHTLFLCLLNLIDTKTRQLQGLNSQPKPLLCFGKCRIGVWSFPEIFHFFWFGLHILTG